MKSVFVGLILPVLLSAAELKEVKSVYLYPMADGLDQHLAHQLTKEGVFRVVADPRLADAVFTDQLGKQFEYRMDHLKPAGDKPVAATPPAPGSQPSAAASTSTEAEPHGSSFSRGKGTIFLVDAKSRQIVWADYQRPKNRSPHELERTAKHLAMDIAKTLVPPAPAAK